MNEVDILISSSIINNIRYSGGGRGLWLRVAVSMHPQGPVLHAARGRRARLRRGVNIKPYYLKPDSTLKGSCDEMYSDAKHAIETNTDKEWRSLLLRFYRKSFWYLLCNWIHLIFFHLKKSLNHTGSLNFPLTKIRSRLKKLLIFSSKRGSERYPLWHPDIFFPG